MTQAAVSLYRSRILAALVFGISVLPGWVLWWLFIPRGKDDGLLLFWSIIAGGLSFVGFVCASRLQKDASDHPQLWRGAVAGVAVIALMLLTLSGLAILAAIAMTAFDAETVREFARELTSFSYLAFSLLISGSMLFIVLSPFGAISGALFYWLEIKRA
jgi:hypothetical protein